MTLCAHHLRRGELQPAGVAVVLLDAEHPAVTRVFVDDVRGGELAAEHLLSRGHERIAFVGDYWPHGYGLTGELLALPEPPTAIFTASDTQALGSSQDAVPGLEWAAGDALDLSMKHGSYRFG